MTRHTPQLIVYAAIVAGTCFSFRAQADSGSISKLVNVEAVNTYWGPGSDLPNSVADGQSFRDKILSSSLFSSGKWYTNAYVWATDFYDPQRTGLNDQDDVYFDSSDSAISYFVGHGVCDTGDTTQYCVSAITCTSPPTGSTSQAFCRRMPGDNFGHCSYTKYTRQLVVGNTTGGGVPHGGTINYSSGNVKWGESSYSGGWAGAGTNGGTNMVVLHSSCAEMSARGHEIWPAFGGIHLLATTLVHSGDVGNSATRGVHFATRGIVNPNGSVSQAWNDALNSNTSRNTWCMNWAGTVSHGGGFGFNGCGAQITTSMGATSTEASQHHSETWYTLRYNANDGKGAGWWESHWTCNYDCNTWTFWN